MKSCVTFTEGENVPTSSTVLKRVAIADSEAYMSYGERGVVEEREA
jgi:hypothetical protein